MGCGASAAPPYQPQEDGGGGGAAVSQPPPADSKPEETAVGGPGEVGGMTVAQTPAPDEDGGVDEDARPLYLPFVRFDKTAVPKELLNGNYVYLQFTYSGNILGGSSAKVDSECTEFRSDRCFAIERVAGEGPLKDGNEVLVKHVESGLYLEALSDQYPVTLRAKEGGKRAQIFRLYKLGRPLAVKHRDTVYLQSHLNNYVEASTTITGEPCTVARRWRRGETATLTILKKEVVESTTTELARKMQFQAFDLDGNGSISRGEMEYMLKQVKGPLEEGELDKVMGACDPAFTGNIPYNAFASWADGGGLSEDMLQHAEVLGNVAQRCNDALHEEDALIEVLTTTSGKICQEMAAVYTAKFSTAEAPADMTADMEKKSSEQDGWIRTNYWKLAMRAMLESEVDLWTRCLNDAMKCWGTDEYALTYLVCTMPERLRVPIFKRYHERFGKGLLEHIQSETSGNYQKVLIYQAMAPEDCRAKLLNDAMAGLGTNEGQLIRVICQLDIPERKQVKEAYMRMFGRDLVDHIKSETSGDFKKALVCMLEAEEADFDIEKDCAAMKKAMDGWGTDEEALIRLICSKTSQQMEQINEKFQELYDKRLIQRVHDETSGYFQATLLGCIRHPMQQLAHSVRFCLEGWGTDNRGLLTMLVHLPDYKKDALVKAYMATFKRDLIKDIKSDCSGNFEAALLALVRPAPRVWAEAIQKAMKGIGTSDQLLINVICIAKDEMGEVRKAFKTLTGKSLCQWIDGDCSGDYKKALLAIASRNSEDDVTMLPAYWAQRCRDALNDTSTLKDLLVALPSVAIRRGTEVFQAVYGRDLREEIKTKCEEGQSWFSWSNYWKETMLKLMDMPVEMYVRGLNDAMRGIGTDERMLTALVCTMPANMYDDIHKLYEERYGRTLIDHIEGDTSFSYKKALVYQALSWPQSRAKALRGALEGLGTDEGQLIRVIVCSTMAERRTIQEAYKEMYKKGLIAHIEEDTSGSFQACLVAVLESCEPQPDDAFDFEEDCNKLKEATEGKETDEDMVIRVVAGKTPQQIKTLRSKYKEMFGEDLLRMIDEELWDWKDTIFGGSNFRECILGLLREPIVALACSVRDCIKGFGTDETGLITCLVHLSERRKADLVNAYMDIKYGGDIFQHVRGDCSGHFQHALLALLKPAPVVWAEALEGAMKGLGTNDELLINTMVIAKARMDEVRDAFFSKHEKELAAWIAGDCSGDYKDTLIRLANRECVKFAGSDVMLTVPPPPSKEHVVYRFCKTFNELCSRKREEGFVQIIPSEEEQQELGMVFMFYGQLSSCAPNLDRQGLWDLTNACGASVGFAPQNDREDLDATFREWNYSGSGEITWNDFVREMTVRINDPNHYNAEHLPENPPE